MLTQLSTIKSRLGIDDFNVQFDTLLTNAISAISSRFDKETNRILSRTVNATHEFCADDSEISVPCYPIESVTKFETKSSETEGWIEQTSVNFLIRQGSVISVNLQPATFNFQPGLARITYTGGYVLPGTTPSPGQTPLPPDLEQAAVEQVAYWFQNRDQLGLKTRWPHAGTYEAFAQLDLLLNVQTVLKRYQRWSI